ncbi:MAG TPA: type I DNA topoisomerase [Candidatus Eremiobacteraeota bacterium]|nr:MAG: DNA topoisomerase 1 [bacterium ADurb.Bin363]HPZ07554.1 type I DNA topoisomerase [Candidatus Eremiobacteraeota bacterium]
MSKSLIIVESPAKARTLKKFLGNKYTVKASMGHVRDLPKSKLGVDIENAFAPQYITIKGKGKIIKELKSAVQKSDRVYLASDPDREGEAIAWHLIQSLNITSPERIELHEITRPALKEALKNSQELNLDKVYAQQARRILDRLVGYKISPLLWRKVAPKLSAGRVQSVAMKLICDREKEIESFVSEEYWTIVAELQKSGLRTTFEATLREKQGKKIKIKNETEVREILQDLNNAEFVVSSVQEKEQIKNPLPPFITSTLQQEASRRLGFRVSKTMKIAQELYEGLDTGKGETTGLITYMRTDSTRVSSLAVTDVREYIKEKFGETYLPSKAPVFKAKNRAQDAHEAIRPTSVGRSPEEVKSFLSKEQYNLYSLIWKRFVASQMKSARIRVITVDIEALNYMFRAIGRRIMFPGFLEVYDIQPGEDEELIKDDLPKLSRGDKLKLITLLPNQYFTQPPPRYTEASLVKILEEKGIGRPSTYAPTIETIRQRGYVRVEKKRFYPTELGVKVTELLVKHFPDIINETFTADMEDKLDKVEEGNLPWVNLLKDFYQPFIITLKKADNEIKKVELTVQYAEEKCNKCGKPMIIKRGRFGDFIACSGFPDCKNTLSIRKTIGVKCPQNGCKGEIVEKFTKKKKLFYGCSLYPACNFSSWYRPTNNICPESNHILVIKRQTANKIFLSCIGPGCEHQEWQEVKNL